MKFIYARIKPHMFDTVREELAKVGVNNISISEVLDYGPTKGHVEQYRGTQHNVGFSKLYRLECLVSSHNVSIVTDLIKRTAHSGDIDDGEIMVFDPEQVVSIQTQQPIYAPERASDDLTEE